MFKCQFHPCPYKSGVEIQCKKHMEKAHGWAYAKNNGQTPPKSISTQSASKSLSTSQATLDFNDLVLSGSEHAMELSPGVISTPFSGTSETGDDFIDSFQLPVHFAGPYVEHSRRITDVSRGLRNVLTVEKWSRGGELGRGGFGTVYLERETDGRVRAIKEVSKQTGRTRTIDHLREVLAMAHFSKEEAFFVTLQGWYQNDSHIYIAMEYFPNGDLNNCVSDALPEEEAQVIAHQLIEALQFMHQRKFTHRDLKPSNVFVVSRAPKWWVKLGDFGVSKRVKGDSTSMHTSIETDYTAPEITGHLMLEEGGSSYTSAVDLWSLGCLVHWLLTSELPLSRRILMSYCMEKTPFSFEQLRVHQCSWTASDFVQKLLRPIPQERLTATEALEHGWPQSYGSESTMESSSQSQPHSALDGSDSAMSLDDTIDLGPSGNILGALPDLKTTNLRPLLNLRPFENVPLQRPESGGKMPEMFQFQLKGRNIRPSVMERKIKQMLGNDAEYTVTSHQGERAYNYWASRQFTPRQIHDLESLTTEVHVRSFPRGKVT